jgi:hypothetical protein
MTAIIPPHQPDRRSQAFRIAQRQREANESRHDRLCIVRTEQYGMVSCWCLCKLCWDPVHRRCICMHCHCHAGEIELPLFVPRVHRYE